MVKPSGVYWRQHTNKKVQSKNWKETWTDNNILKTILQNKAVALWTQSTWISIKYSNLLMWTKWWTLKLCKYQKTFFLQAEGSSPLSILPNNNLHHASNVYEQKRYLSWAPSVWTYGARSNTQTFTCWLKHHVSLKTNSKKTIQHSVDTKHVQNRAVSCYCLLFCFIITSTGYAVTSTLWKQARPILSHSLNSHNV